MALYAYQQFLKPLSSGKLFPFFQDLLFADGIDPFEWIEIEEVAKLFVGIM